MTPGGTRRSRELADALGVQTVATGDAHAHHSRRAPLQDALVAIKHRTSLDGCERERRGNHESVLLPPAAMAERFPDDPGAVARAGELAARLEFDLTQELGYRYPDFSDGDEPAIAQLAGVCNRAFDERYAARTVTRSARGRRLDEELALIGELGLAGFLPPALGGARAGAGGRARGARRFRRPERPSARPRARAARSARSSAT